MGFFSQLIQPAPVSLHTWSTEACGASMISVVEDFTAMTSFTWPAGGVAVYFPFSLSQCALITKLWLKNGASPNSTQTYQIGIYTSDGRLIVTTGDINQSNSNDNLIETTDITDTLLCPGEYYLAMAGSGTSITAHGTTLSSAEIGKMMGWYEQAGLTGSTLPATATFATYTRTINPFIGMLIGPRTAL
jgi:hypothetical protein